MTRADTLTSVLEYWAPNVEEIAGEVPFVIVGNKSDLKDQYEVSNEDLESIPKQLSTVPILPSAKTGKSGMTIHEKAKSMSGRLLYAKTQKATTQTTKRAERITRPSPKLSTALKVL